MKTADIRTNHQDVSCDVCGRTLLRGENPTAFLAGGSRRQVCELCTVRAAQEGWIRESGDSALIAPGSSEHGRRSLFGRLRQLRERAATEPDGEPVLDPYAQRSRRVRRVEAEPQAPRNEPAPAVEPAEPTTPPPPSREPRHVRAVPTNADLKMERALALFNGSDYTRTVAGVARSLGEPAINVRALTDRPSVVAIAVMWELSWYRFEVDLSDEANGVQKIGQGAELAELTASEHTVNASADDRGALVLAAPATA